MRIMMDQDTCTTILSACENCFASFLLRGCVPDRGCIMAVKDDGHEETTSTHFMSRSTAASMFGNMKAKNDFPAPCEGIVDCALKFYNDTACLAIS